jgi:diguanylate cyclase (GGDEF)-like protein
MPLTPGEDGIDPHELRVLIIEDDVDTASLIEATIARVLPGSETVLVGSIAEAAELDLRPFDLTLCDHNLPDGDALSVIELQSRTRPDLPLVVITGEHEATVAAELIRHGASDYLPKSFDFLKLLPVVISKNLESARIRRDNHRLQSALASSLAELKRKNRELAESAARYKQLATTDPLTGLANRRVLDERLVQMFAEAQRYRNPLTCLMIDLDGFKGVNDTLGHRLGDQLLELAGQLITREIRTSDLGVRYGGDEFVILQPHTNQGSAAQFAARLTEKFAMGSRVLTGPRMSCAMSVGIASTAPACLTQPWELIARADFALYAAKANKGDGERIMLCDADGEHASPYRPEAA